MRLTLLRHGAVRHPEHQDCAAEARGVNRERGEGLGIGDGDRANANQEAGCGQPPTANF